MTLTESGISLKVAGNHSKVEIPWEIVIGSGAMLEGQNRETMIRSYAAVMHALGHQRYLKRVADRLAGKQAEEKAPEGDAPQ